MTAARRSAALAVAALVFAVTAGAEEPWTVTSGEVRVRCRLTVGGSFDAVTSQISGAIQLDDADGPRAPGQLRVRLDSLDTGIELRNRHLRETYLEVGRGEPFREAVLTAVELAEPVPPGVRDHESAFRGLLSLHGMERRVEGEARLLRRGGWVRVEAEFALSLAEFAIPPPRYLGVGVRDEVRITVTFDAGIPSIPQGVPP